MSDNLKMWTLHPSHCFGMIKSVFSVFSVSSKVSLPGRNIVLTVFQQLKTAVHDWVIKSNRRLHPKQFRVAGPTILLDFSHKESVQFLNTKLDFKKDSMKYICRICKTRTLTFCWRWISCVLCLFISSLVSKQSHIHFKLNLPAIHQERRLLAS